MLLLVLASAISSCQLIALTLRGPCLMNQIADVFVQSTLKTARILNSLTLIRMNANVLATKMFLPAEKYQKLHFLTKKHAHVSVMSKKRTAKVRSSLTMILKHVPVVAARLKRLAGTTNTQSSTAKHVRATVTRM